jgi:energy-converting hydrogenase Eha subunit C
VIAVIVLLMYVKVRDKKQTVSPYNLNLPNWLLITVGTICFLGATLQIILRIFNLE